MVDKEIIDEAKDMVKDIPAEDVLTPLQLEETELTPYPEIEYKIIESTSMDKLVRDVNNHLKNGWQTEWGIQVASGNISKFYQSMIRWNVDANIGPKLGSDSNEVSDLGTKPEMPSKNSETGSLGPNAPLWEGMKFLEDEEDLYEDIDKDETNWNSVAW